MAYNPKIVSAFFVSFGLPAPEFEYRFHPVRKWRWDICWDRPEHMLALEIQGAIWGTGKRCRACGQSKAGRHTRGAGLVKEHEKLNHGAMGGWRVLFVQPKELCTARTAGMVKECLQHA